GGNGPSGPGLRRRVLRPALRQSGRHHGHRGRGLHHRGFRPGGVQPQFWDLASESLRTETPLESSFFHTDHTPDGSLLVTTRWDIDESFDRPVGVWDTRTGELIHELEAPDQGAP